MESQLEEESGFDSQTSKEETREENARSEESVRADIPRRCGDVSENNVQPVQHRDQHCGSAKMADEKVENWDINSLFDRQVTVYRIEDEDEPDDDFYTVTTSDVLAIQKRLQETSKRLCNPPLVSQTKLQELEFDRKRSSWKVTVIKVKLPRQWVLQATFLSEEPVKKVHEFVKCCLANPEAAFSLLLLPAQTITPSEKGLIEAGLSPFSVLILRGFPADLPIEAILRPELLKMASSSSVALSRSRQSLSENRPFIPPVI